MEERAFGERGEGGAGEGGADSELPDHDGGSRGEED